MKAESAQVVRYCVYEKRKIMQDIYSTFYTSLTVRPIQLFISFY